MIADFKLVHTVLLIISIANVGCDRGPRIDYTKNSSNITQRLNYDTAYPFVGFWKINSNDDFGLAIDKRENEQYTVGFCGPGGTGELSLLSPTKIYDDQRFKVLDADTIQSVDVNGQFTTYKRSK